LEDVYDPTGAGDTFCRRVFLAYIAKQGGDISESNLRRAVVFGTAMAFLHG